MGKISLRGYNREIERLIENGQIDQAIAHCRHILDAYPKHIETYRLLGKAYLESQRYGDAADILQRVLSSIPEDFLSHVGMSIIREDEGNIDEAIWHMERAFEVQPANNAIQDELRRLYGRRDGFEPPKVRLTRGALARMYVKGELFPQAIAELRAALAEDPQRLDLQVLLAHAYARTGQQIEAADMCSALLRKLPYCLEANQIMADVLASTERKENSQAYRQRVVALDPYAAFLSPDTSDSNKVPDQAVTLEKLDWHPDQGTGSGTGRPEWASSLGLNLGESSNSADVPDWLKSIEEQESEEKPAGKLPWDQEDEQGLEELPKSGAAGGEEPAEDEIPDWMKEAGWKPGPGETDEGPGEPYFEYEEEDQGQAELPSAEIPDWLRKMAPEEESGEAEGEPEAGLIEWSVGVEEEEAEFGEASETQPEEAEPGEIPDWIIQETEKEEDTGSLEASIPDWLRDFRLSHPPPPRQRQNLNRRKSRNNPKKPRTG